MGKLRDWLHGDGDRPRWSRLQYAVAACAEDLQDELQDEWNDWTSDKFTGYGSEDEFDSCSEWDDDEAVDRAKEWLGWSPIDREANGYGDGDERDDDVTGTNTGPPQEPPKRLLPARSEDPKRILRQSAPASHGTGYGTGAHSKTNSQRPCRVCATAAQAGGSGDSAGSERKG